MDERSLGRQVRGAMRHLLRALGHPQRRNALWRPAGEAWKRAAGAERTEPAGEARPAEETKQQAED